MSQPLSVALPQVPDGVGHTAFMAFHDRWVNRSGWGHSLVPTATILPPVTGIAQAILPYSNATRHVLRISVHIIVILSLLTDYVMLIVDGWHVQGLKGT